MKTLNYLIIALVALLVSSTSHAQRYSKTTYVHSDPDGTSFAATNSQGSEEWKIEHFPFGREYQNTSQDRKNDISFAGKPYDEEIGLSYFGGRWYDPDAGRFTSIDPMPVQFNDYESFNRYVYGFNNPYKYVDPDGNFPFLIPVAIFISKEIAAEGASRATGGATDFLSFRRLGTKALKKGALEFKSFNKVKDNGAPAIKKTKLSGKNPPINQNRQKLHTNGTEGKSQFKDSVDADNLVQDAWRNGTPKFNKNGKLIGKVKEYKDTVGTQGQTSVDTRFSRKHGVHGFPSKKKE